LIEPNAVADLPGQRLAGIFIPDSRRVLSASIDGTARVWDLRTDKPVTLPLAIGGTPLTLAVTPDGKHDIVGGASRALFLIDLGKLSIAPVDPNLLCRWAELLSGRRLHEGVTP
jgi:WD40 repeat protein